MRQYHVQYETAEGRGGFTVSGYTVSDVLAGLFGLGYDQRLPYQRMTKLVVKEME